MEKVRILLAGFLLTVTSFLGAQEVVATGGDYFENANGSVSFTLCEVVIETIENENNCLTQGFQQSSLNVYTSIKEHPGANEMEISVYPNPTYDFIKLKTNNFDGLKYQLCNFNGEIMHEGKIKNKETEISFVDYARAIYLLRVIRNNNELQVFKILKQ